MQVGYFGGFRGLWCGFWGAVGWGRGVWCFGVVVRVGCFWGVGGAYSRGGGVVGRGILAWVFVGSLEGFGRVG